MENECKTPIGCLELVFYQKYFYDKMDCSLFFFNLMKYRSEKTTILDTFQGANFSMLFCNCPKMVIVTYLVNILDCFYRSSNKIINKPFLIKEVLSTCLSYCKLVLILLIQKNKAQ